jgi:hypothetical protein
VDHSSDAVADEASGKKSSRVLKFPGALLYLVAAGCFMDLFSTFLPWSEHFGSLTFLPYSTPLPLGWNAYFIESLSTAIISVIVRLAAVTGLVGLLLHEYRKGVLPKIVIFASTGLSFASVVLFVQLDWSLYWGVYSVLLAGGLKVVGLILENFQFEITLE